MSEEVDDFLMHFGVVGMKWGKRKAVYQQGGTGIVSRYKAEGQRVLDKNNGSKAKAITKTAGKTVGTSLLLAVGHNYIRDATGLIPNQNVVRSVRMGEDIVHSILQVSNMAIGVADTVALAKAKSNKKGQ